MVRDGRLGALRPHDVPHATEYIDQMVALIEELAGGKSPTRPPTARIWR